MPTKDAKNSGQHKPRRTYTQDELLILANELRTGGRKGAALPRVNLAFAPEVLHYLRTMTQLRGESMTKYIDRLLRADMEKNADLYRKAADLIEKL